MKYKNFLKITSFMLSCAVLTASFAAVPGSAKVSDFSVKEINLSKEVKNYIDVGVCAVDLVAVVGGVCKLAHNRKLSAKETVDKAGIEKSKELHEAAFQKWAKGEYTHWQLLGSYLGDSATWVEKNYPDLKSQLSTLHAEDNQLAVINYRDMSQWVFSINFPDITGYIKTNQVIKAFAQRLQAVERQFRSVKNPVLPKISIEIKQKSDVYLTGGLNYTASIYS